MKVTGHQGALSSTAGLAHAPEPTSLPREALSISEAAVSLGVGRDQIYKIIARKELRAVKCGRRTLVPLAALRSYLDGLPELQLGSES